MSFYKAPRYILRKHNILSFLKKIDYETFLDVGCGAGELACTLSYQGKKGVATDFSKQAINTAEDLRIKMGIKKSELEFIVGDGTTNLSKKFDLVICCEVLEHIKNDRNMLKKLISKSDGYILISVPAKMHLYDESDESVGHYRRYEKNQVIKLVESEGLEVINFANYGYPFTNWVRLLRKSLFKLRLKKSMSIKPEDLSKDSGINPVEAPRIISKFDLEKVFLPLYWFSRLFNQTNLGEGYLIMCKKSEGITGEDK